MNLTQSSNKMYLDLRIPFGESFVNSDIIAVNYERAIIIDIQVVRDARTLDLAHGDLGRKYSGRDFIRTVQDRYNVKTALTTSVT